MNLLIINGPNLNLLGQREPKIYGKETLKDILDDVFLYSKNHNIDVDAFQSNHEGEIIDSIADAGGDATRINGIDFTVEDTSQFMDELREQAMQQAFDKAQHLADLGGVSLGQLSYVGEAGNVGQVSGGFERAMAMSAPSTSISSGELELSLAINVAFGIR